MEYMILTSARLYIDNAFLYYYYVYAQYIILQVTIQNSSTAELVKP